jgi:hypothetical protein
MGLPSIDARSTMLDGHWHFHCPECGMGDFELGHLAGDQEFICQVCLEEGRGTIHLQRWPGQGNDAPDYALFRPGLAA